MIDGKFDRLDELLATALLSIDDIADWDCDIDGGGIIGPVIPGWLIMLVFGSILLFEFGDGLGTGTILLLITLLFDEGVWCCCVGCSCFLLLSKEAATAIGCCCGGCGVDVGGIIAGVGNVIAGISCVTFAVDTFPVGAVVRLMELGWFSDVVVLLFAVDWGIIVFGCDVMFIIVGAIDVDIA